MDVSLHRGSGEGRVRSGLIPRLPALLRRAARLAELALFPSVCKICETLLESPGERILCAACLDKIRPHKSAACLSCGRFFEGAGGPHVCAACLASPPRFARHRSAALYRGEVKDALLLLKYRGFRPLARDLGRMAAQALADEAGIWEGADALVPVPLHPARRRERGFNQARDLAAELSRWRGLPVDGAGLRRVRRTQPQTRLERGDRPANVRGAFAAAATGRAKGKVLVLVDDVYTTGSTLRECAAALRRAGAKEVRAVTIAQA